MLWFQSSYNFGADRKKFDRPKNSHNSSFIFGSAQLEVNTLKNISPLVSSMNNQNMFNHDQNSLSDTYCYQSVQKGIPKSVTKHQAFIMLT